MKTVLIGLGIAIVLGLIFLGISKIDFPDCVESHQETRHQEEYTTYSNLNGTPWVGNGVPIAHTHPARDYQVTVCDKWE